MANGNDSLGDLVVSITGEFPELQSAIDAAVSKSQDGAEAIQSALSIPNAGEAIIQAFSAVGAASTQTGIEVENLVRTLDELITKEQNVQDTFQQAVSVYNDTIEAYRNGEASVSVLETAYEQLDSAAKNAGQSLGEAGGAAEQAGESAHHAEGGFEDMATELLKMGGIALTAEKIFETIKDTIEEAFKAFSQVQTATIALTALTKDAAGATESIEKLKVLAISDALSFPALVQATQRMTAFGIETEKIPVAIQAAADASAATGNSFDAVSGAIERMALSGNAGARQLVQLGLSAQDLARAMNTSAAGVKDSFKEMDPSERVDVIVSALGKFQGTAQAVAQGIAGQWQNLKTQWDFVLEDIGAALEPAGKAIIDFAKTGVDGAKQVATAFSQLESSLGAAFHEISGAATEAYDSLVPKELQSQLPTLAQNIIGQFTNPITLSLKALKVAADEFKDTWASLSTLAGNASSSMGDALAAALKKAADAAQTANTNTIALGNSLLQLLPATSDAEKAQTAAAEAVETTGRALAEEKARLDAGAGSWQAYTRLLNAYDEAVQKATPHSKDFADSVAGIAEAVSQAQSKYDNALKVFNQIKDAYDQGKASAEALALAEKKLDDAYTAINPKLKDHATGVDAIFEATNKARQAWADAQTTLQGMLDLFTKGQAGAQDLAIAIQQARDAAQAAGQTISQGGSGVAAAVGILGENAGVAGVTINGKFVPALSGLADAAQAASDKAKALADDVVRCGDSADGALPPVLALTDAEQSLGDAMAWGSDQAQALIDKWNDLASSADTAAAAVNTLADAEENESTVSSSSSGGKGGKGGKGGGMSAAEFLSEAIAVPFGVGSNALGFDIAKMAQQLADATGQIVQTSQGTYAPTKAAGAKAAGTDEFGRPLAAASSGGSSAGVAALSSAATAAATAVTNLGSSATSSTTGVNSLWQAAINGTLPITALGTAAGGAAVPLGAFVTSTTGATVAVTALSDAAANLGNITGQLSDASKRHLDETTAEADALAKANPDLQAFADTVKASSDAQATLNQAMDALQRATDRDNTAVEQGRLTQDAATRDLLTYAQAVQKATDALDAMGSHILAFTENVSSPTGPSTPLSYTPASPSTQTGFTEGFGQTAALSFTPAVPGNQSGIQLAGIDSKTYAPQGGLPSSYSTPSAEGATTNGGITLVVNVNGGTNIGTNAGRELAKLTMPEMVAMLRLARVIP